MTFKTTAIDHSAISPRWTFSSQFSLVRRFIARSGRAACPTAREILSQFA